MLLKQISISFLVGCILTFIGINIYNNKKQNNLQQAYQKLQADNKDLQVELKNNSTKLNDDDKKIAQLQTQNDVDALENKQLKKELNDIKKPLSVPPIVSTDDIKTRICTLYKDCDVNETNGIFSIKYKTTSLMLYDAEEWNTQGSYLTNKLDASLKLNVSFEKSLGDCKSLSNEKDIKMSDLLDRYGLHVKVENNLNSQIGNLNQQLKVGKRDGKIRFIKGVVIGGTVAGGIVYLIKRK